MSHLDFTTLEALRSHHPAWRLLRSDHAPLVASFLYKAFIARNVRVFAFSELAELLEDELYALRDLVGQDAFPRSGADYLNEWASHEKGWLRKFYRRDSDEPYLDLTPATEKALGWLTSLADRTFVGTQSRLLTLFDLLRQMSEGTEEDPEKRIEELLKKRSAIDDELDRVRSGDLKMLDRAELKDRFQQFTQLAKELLSDFREVEQNFRLLDRRVRERIALWQGSKGALLEEIMGERDAISDSDQGRSFRAFWDFLMSRRRQEELSSLLGKVLLLPPVQELNPDRRTSRIHYDWLEAADHTQRTVAQLSEQLRRFLDDQAWLENKRIMEILRGIEAKALALREAQPTGQVMTIAESSALIELPMERPLFVPTIKHSLHTMLEGDDEIDLDTSSLYSQLVVDKGRLIHHIRRTLGDRSQVTLGELVQSLPLERGLAEIVAYIQLGVESFACTVDDSLHETIRWSSEETKKEREARLPRIIFVR